ncbi:hypothetical protein [Streptomyces misionensis]|uniref:hypothetical protein n=1 Tax=Streptomyces misionensis TaxID=67331 RepID=UPI0033F8A007
MLNHSDGEVRHAATTQVVASSLGSLADTERLGDPETGEGAREGSEGQMIDHGWTGDQ